MINYDAENEKLLETYRATSDNEVLGKLYNLNYGLFVRICQKRFYLSEYEDLLQECYFALIKAVETYNSEYGTFYNYLIAVTINYLQRVVCESGIIRTPQYMQELIYKYKLLYDKKLTSKQICAQMEITHEQLNMIKRILIVQNVRSLDAPIKADNDNMTLGDIIADQEQPEEEILDNIFNSELAEALQMGAEQQLSEREKDYLFKRYYENLTYSEIDQEHSNSNTRRIIEKALRKLRKNETLQRFYAEQNLFICNSLSYFRINNTSSVERVVLKLYK